MGKTRRILFFLLVALPGAITLPAQTATGGVKGVLMDDSGAVIPATNVIVSRAGSTKTAQTQADGTFSVPGLPPGQYTVAVTYPGFAAFSKAVNVGAGAPVQMTIRLAVSAEKQEVTVQAEAGPSVSVEADNNTSAIVMKGEDLEALPDDPDDLSDALQALAGPGAGPMAGRSTSTASPAASFRPRNRSARSVSIRILFRRNSTGWVSAASRSSPSREPIRCTA